MCICVLAYDDDIALLTNTLAQGESLLHSLEKATGAIGLHECRQNGDITKLNGGYLKLVDKFTYLGTSVQSTENYINRQLEKVYTSIERISVTLKSDLSD